MRIALISDIHGNLPALEAVLQDIDARAVDAIYHLGDLVGYGPWPNEVVDLIRSRGIAGVAGNYDSTVAAGYKHCGCKYESPEQEALSHESYAWTLARTKPEAKAFLGSLPFRLDVRFGGGHLSGPGLLLFHGTPTLNTLYWTEDRPDDFNARMIAAAGARSGDVVGFGHTHLPWQRDVGGVRLINTGSVGRPKDGNWRAGYVLLGTDGGIAAEVIRVPYDLERSAAEIEASTLPKQFAEQLRRGGVS